MERLKNAKKCSGNVVLDRDDDGSGVNNFMSSSFCNVLGAAALFGSHSHGERARRDGAQQVVT